jgi:hypothetical protein
LHDDRPSAAVSECGGDRAGVVTGPSYGHIAAAQPLSEHSILGRRSGKQRGACCGLSGDPSIDQAAVNQQFRALIMAAQQKLMIWELLPEAVDRRHGEQKVSEPSRMQHDNRTGHDFRKTTAW